MRTFYFLIILFVLLAPRAHAGPQEEAFEILKKWTTAFTMSDVDSITGLYAADALFLGTGSKEVVTDPSLIRAYFEQALLNNKPRTATINSYSAYVVSDTVVVFSGLDIVTGVREGKQFSSPGRVTFVVSKRDSDWKIVQFHRSALPE